MKTKGAQVLTLSLHNTLVGHLIGYPNGRNVLRFVDAFRANSHRPTFSLVTHPTFPRAQKLMEEPWARNQRLHPVLSNLLPEGLLRQLIAEQLKVHIDSEFHLLSALGQDLPGALVATPLEPDEAPLELLNYLKETTHTHALIEKPEHVNLRNKFSLAGIQMKFSMKEKKNGRYTLSQPGMWGDWIIKTPSTKHRDVPLNEYTAMRLAALAGVNIPEIKLVGLESLENLPPINLPNESLAFAIRRFDRHDNQRIHMEDFAQALIKYPHEKYNSANYEQIGKMISDFSVNPLADLQEFARRLLVNILLANGDAHLKNWSLLYADTITPQLAPAYDIVTTSVYIEQEQEFALNLGKTKNWYRVSLTHFEYWCKKVGVSWDSIHPILTDVLEKAQSTWHDALHNLPMNEAHKHMLRTHWRNLHPDFKI